MNECVSDVAVRRAATRSRVVTDATRALVADLGADLEVVFCFVSPTYDLDALGPALTGAFPGAQVVGCTTSGQIGEHGFQPEGITAIGLGAGFRAHTHVIDLDHLSDDLERISPELGAVRPGESSFGFLLVDGLSASEERLAAALYAGTGIPVVGGSAGDDLRFEETHVLAEGRFQTNVAAFTVLHTTLPFRTVRVMHHVPGPKRLVITDADPSHRLVRAINGRPAAPAYAEAIGIAESELGPAAFSRHPLMLVIDGEPYIRSIQRVEDDGAIRLYCAIERGLVLRLGERARVMEALEESFADVADQLGGIAGVLGCDCILRRLELEDLGAADDVGAFFADHGVVGFSTYGEQIDGLHMNQTFTGIAFGARS